MTRHFFAPTTDLRDTYLHAMREYAEHDGRPDADGLDLDDLTSNLDDYVRDLQTGAIPRPGILRGTNGSELWWCETYNDGTAEYLGRTTIRHSASRATWDRGGHLWISIRPTRRDQGLGTELLAAALPVAASHGIDTAVLVCAEDDTPARRVIERNGGVPARADHSRVFYEVPTLQPVRV